MGTFSFGRMRWGGKWWPDCLSRLELDRAMGLGCQLTETLVPAWRHRGARLRDDGLAAGMAEWILDHGCEGVVLPVEGRR